MSWRNPTKPHAVYRIWSANGDLLYVGCSVNPLSRIMEHSKYKAWSVEIDTVKVQWFGSKPEAQAAEKSAIQSENPRWNNHYTGEQKRVRGVFHSEYDRNDPSTLVSA